MILLKILFNIIVLYQVHNLFIINFQIATFYQEFSARIFPLLLSSCSEQIVEDPRLQTPVRGIWALQLQPFSLHSKSFTCSRLAIGEYAGIVTFSDEVA